MDGFDALVKAIANVNSGFTIAAYSIAAVVFLSRLVLTRDKSSSSISIPPSLAWAVIIAMVILGTLPTLANTWLEHKRMNALTVYRVTALVLNPEGNPVSGASLRTTTKNIASTGPDGTAEVAIYKATLPADGKVTIYADMESEFLHGHSEIQLDKDPNPSLPIKLAAQGNAMVSGLVED